MELGQPWGRVQLTAGDTSVKMYEAGGEASYMVPDKAWTE